MKELVIEKLQNQVIRRRDRTKYDYDRLNLLLKTCKSVKLLSVNLKQLAMYLSLYDAISANSTAQIKRFSYTSAVKIEAVDNDIVLTRVAKKSRNECKYSASTLAFRKLK